MSRSAWNKLYIAACLQACLNQTKDETIRKENIDSNLITQSDKTHLNIGQNEQRNKKRYRFIRERSAQAYHITLQLKYWFLYHSKILDLNLFIFPKQTITWMQNGIFENDFDYENTVLRCELSRWICITHLKYKEQKLIKKISMLKMKYKIYCIKICHNYRLKRKAKCLHVLNSGLVFQDYLKMINSKEFTWMILHHKNKEQKRNNIVCVPGHI